MEQSGLTQLGDGVWAFLRPSGGWGEANTGLVVAPGAASLVVDTMWDVAWAKRVADVQRPLVADAPVTEPSTRTPTATTGGATTHCPQQRASRPVPPRWKGCTRTFRPQY